MKINTLMQVCIRAVARLFKKKAPEVRSEKNEGKIYRPFMYLDESGFIVGVKAFTHLVFDYNTKK